MSTKIQLTAEEKYRLLRDISYKIRDTLDLKEILNQLLDTVHQIVPYDAAGVFVLSHDIRRTPYHHDRALIAGIAERGFDQRSDALDPMLMSGKGIVGVVIRTGESMVVPDVRLDKRYVAGRAATRSEIAVPIIRDKRPVGALNLESDRLNAFDEKDIEVLQFVADAASISIEKSILHTEILEKRRIDDQLQIAAELQARLLPTGPPKVEGYSIAGLCTPAYEVGGDYFDYVRLENGRLGVVVADVSGNGIPAAMLMTSFRALFMPGARAGVSPATLMGQMNMLLPEFARKRDFITAFYGILDVSSGAFTYANCGHNLPFIVRADGRIERLTQSGPSLILLSDTDYEAGMVVLHESELLVLYTDGVVEVFDDHQREFGNERLEEVARKFSGGSADAVLREIVAATRSFSGSELSHDDSTLVVIKRESH
ncbi:MAG TPA: GAF domain-containing SpoIIE family protein phosphatase [Bacteroidota bacterium]|nr:GAF domain-containing SpoIIE family protein phosphatase [Bacteroidota bacterium]